MADEPDDKSPDGADGQPPDGLPLGPLDRAAFLRQEAELAAAMRAKLDQACQPTPPAAPGSNKLGARKDASFKAICTAPSINWTPAGSGQVPVPYQTVQDLSNSMATARTVRFNGLPVYLLDQTTQPKGTGDERGTKKGIRSGTVTGEVKPVNGCKTVRIEGKQVVREGDKCTMNGGNNPGVFVTSATVSTAQSTLAKTGTLQCQPDEQAKKDAASLGIDGLRTNGLFKALGKAFPGFTEPQQYFQPENTSIKENQHLRTANNIVFALIGPLAAPAVFERIRGASEESVSAANAVGTGLFSMLGAGILRGRSARPKQEVTPEPNSSLNTVTPRASNNGLRITPSAKLLQYQPSSGVQLRADPSKTTTVLGSYTKDMKFIVEETGNIKSTDLGPRRGDFNILNVPDELYVTPKQFWNEYNKPWLDNAIQRNDRFLMATKPGFDVPPNAATKSMSVLTTKNPQTGGVGLSGFGREYLTLRRNGYRYENGEMKK